jgi:tetratricopeptide (TPR) repeat protein
MARERRPPSARRRGPGPRKRPDRSRRPPPETKPRKGEGGLSRQAADEIRAAAGTRAPQVIELVERAGQSLEQGRPTEAVQEASRAKALASRSSTVREVLALALYRAGQFREAIRELQAYRRITGRADQNHLLADSFRATGAPERAVPLAEEAIRSPVPLEVRAEAAVVGGAALADLGRYEEALALLRRFDREDASSQPHDLRVWYVIADVLERAGRRKEAAERFRRIMAHDPDAYDVAERLSALS